MAAELLRLYHLCDSPEEGGSEQHPCTKAMEYVQQHYGNAELSVDEVCAYLHVSTSHFSNIFRKETGMSFLAFLTKKRVDEAVRLLKTTDEKAE